MEPDAALESVSFKRQQGKSASAFRTISEVAKALELPQHVLRFWETKFQNIKPLKRGGGRRYYRPGDVALLKQIRNLLYDDGYTIKGVQKLFRESGGPPSTQSQFKSGSSPEPIQAENISINNEQITGISADIRMDLQSVLSELKNIRNLLKSS